MTLAPFSLRGFLGSERKQQEQPHELPTNSMIFRNLPITWERPVPCLPAARGYSLANLTNPHRGSKPFWTEQYYTLERKPSMLLLGVSLQLLPIGDSAITMRIHS